MQAILFMQLGNESSVLSLSEKLHYLEAILVYSVAESKKLTATYRNNLRKTTSLKLYFGIECTTQKEARIKGFDVKFQLGTRNKEPFSGVTHVYNNEFEAEKDFVHQRRSGLNHILLTIFAKHKVVVVLNFSGLQGETLKKQAKLIGRFIQNNKLAKQKAVTVLAATIATNSTQLRSAHDVAALQRLLQ